MNKLFTIFFILLIAVNILTPVSSLSISTHVPEKYTDVIAGERFYFEISIKYPENPRRKDLRLEYEILDIDGKLIAQSKVLKAIETQASFIDFIVIPESVNSGLHIINIKITDYESLSEEVSASFQVTKSSTEDIMLYLILILGAVLLVGLLVIVTIFKVRKK